MTPVMVANTKSTEVLKLLEEKLIPALADQPLAIAAAAMLMVILTSMRPDIEGDELVEGITGASAWIVTYLDSLDKDQTVN